MHRIAPLPLVLISTFVVADDRPWTDAHLLAQPGVESAELVFTDAPHRQCHASTIAEGKDGLVAAWFGGTREKHDDVGIWVARKVDGAWTKPVRVADGSEGEERDFPCWNPVLFQPSKGPLLLFYKVGPSPSTWWGVMLTSSDGGATWTDRRKLGRNDAIGHLLGPVKNKPIELEDGTILCPSSTEHDGWRVHFERTADLGRTWEVVGPIPANRFNAIQPSILVQKDGRFRVLCRSREGVIATSTSSDDGKSWSRVIGTKLPNPNAGTDAVTLADGRHLLVYNHTVRGGAFPSGRNMLNVAVSRDGSRWSASLVLELARGEYSYPAVIQTADGRVHITYTFERTHVKHVVLDPEKLETKAIVNGRWPRR